MARLQLLARALISKRWWLVSLVVVLLMVVLARLGFWQLDRLAERREANTAIRIALDSAPIQFDGSNTEFSDLSPADVPPDLANRNATVSGLYDYDHQIIVKIQTWEGRNGVRLVTPLLLTTGDTADPLAILVDRGWIPEDEYTAGNQFNESVEADQLGGYIALTETLLRQISGPPELTPNGIEVYRVDVDNIAPTMPYRLMPFYIRLNPDEQDPEALPIRMPREVDLSEGPHLGYAIQWFIFALGLGGGYVLYVNRSLTLAVRELEDVA